MFIKPAKRPKPSENLTQTVMRGTEQATNNNTDVSGVVFLHLHFWKKICDSSLVIKTMHINQTFFIKRFSKVGRKILKFRNGRKFDN